MKRLPKPKSQLQEVLYELIYRFSIDRKTMMLLAEIHNLPARIFDLRKKGVQITTKTSEIQNRYGRTVITSMYLLNNKKNAVEIYKLLQTNQTKYKFKNERNK